MVDNEACAAVISDKLREGGLNSADDAVFAMSVSTFLNLESARDRGASDADNEASVVAAEASSDFRSRGKSGGKKLHVSTDADQSVEDVPADEGKRLARTVSVSVREVAANPSKFLCTPKGTKCASPGRSLAIASELWSVQERQQKLLGSAGIKSANRLWDARTLMGSRCMPSLSHSSLAFPYPPSIPLVFPEGDACSCCGTRCSRLHRRCP